MEAPPALLAAVLREHGPEALEDVERLLGDREATSAPRAALEALEVVAETPRAAVRRSVGALYRTLLRLAVDGRLRRHASKPDGGGLMAKVDQLIDQVPAGDARATLLREAKYRAGRQLERRARMLEQASPVGQVAARVLGAVDAHVARARKVPPTLDVARYCLPEGIEARAAARLALVSDVDQTATKV